MYEDCMDLYGDRSDFLLNACVSDTGYGDRRICNPSIRSVPETSLCSEHGKQKHLPKVQN